MPTADFIEMVGICFSGLQEEMKDQMILQSFGSWQIIETLKAMFIEKAKPMSFHDYLVSYGLTEKSSEPEVRPEDAYDAAEEIAKLARMELKRSGN